MSKIDSIENHFTLLQQDIGKMRSEVKEMDTRLTDIENAVSFMETTYTEVNQIIGRDNRKIKDIEEELKQLKSDQINKNYIEQQVTQVEHLRTQNEVLSKQVNGLDAYSRRSNLIFEGIPEERGEDTWEKIKNVISAHMRLSGSEIKIERCHRLHGSKSLPKPIIVCFNWNADRQEVWNNRRHFKGTNYIVREDFPVEMQKNQKNTWSCSKSG